MATLIQSKQIQGIVTASLIEGDFAVNAGSVNLAAASGVTGSFSGSFVGDGSGIQGIDYSQIDNTPVFLPGNNITITSGSNIITITSTASGGGGSNESLNSFTASYYTDSSSFDSRIVGISASGSGADWNTNLQNIPSNLISGSIQILGGTDIISSSAQISSLGFLTSSHTDISSLNDYTSSNDLRLTNLESTTSSLDTRITQLSDSTGSYETIGRGIISSSEQFPSGLVSGSSQITLSSTTGYNSNEHFTQANITTVGTVTSGNINAILPSGVISGSTQITDGSGIVSSSAFTSPSQGTVRATLNGTQTDVDTGLQTSDSPQFTNLTLTGDLTVQGTTTTISSTTVNIGDRIIELNYAEGAGDAGLLVSDVVGGATVSGSLLWDASEDYWMAGALGSEKEVARLNASPTSNTVLKADSNGLLVDSLIADDGTNVTISGTAELRVNSATANSFVYYDANKSLESVQPSTAGDVIQWNGSSFVASNEIDGGTF